MSASPELLNGIPDVGEAFRNTDHEFFLPTASRRFDAAKRAGVLHWAKHALRGTSDFRQASLAYTRMPERTFRGPYYGDETLPFAVSFPGPRTIRLRISARGALRPDRTSLMLAGPVKDHGKLWKTVRVKDGVRYDGPHGSVTVSLDPWRITLADSSGRVLTSTRHLADTGCFMNWDPQPFSFCQTGGDHRRHVCASFAIRHDEAFFGCGESFTRLNKRGQRVVLWAHDAQGVQTSRMYKPIPFFLSSAGYGMFVHTSTPVSFDFGKTYDETCAVFSGDDQLDLFVYLGDPKQVLGAYTETTGRSPMVPVWSLGLWMSRITYKSEAETRAVAKGLRRHRIPSDVIHLDTGWFEQDWRCDYKFAPSRFRNPAGMLRDLDRQGFKTCLWQLPYFTHDNLLYPELRKKGYLVGHRDGADETQEAALDVSNPAAVRWFQSKLSGLLRQGVAAIKVDFGEAGPPDGRYASGKSGWVEHNLYPLRYNKAAAEITGRIHGNGMIWARSAWAGSQRYPLHWGGDAENTDSAMAASLRAGLSFGMSGFTFWSHDVGGFVKPAPADLYARWLAFGVLTSHTRCHGAPPREPWEYGVPFMNLFRKIVELKYRLMPYVVAQARASARAGLPVLRPLFLEHPDDPGSWLPEDEYLLGTDLLVAPLLTPDRTRNVYLPPGRWVDYQTRRIHDGPGWRRIAAGEVPVVLLVRAGAAIPHAPLAQSTAFIDWKRVAPVRF